MARIGWDLDGVGFDWVSNFREWLCLEGYDRKVLVDPLVYDFMMHQWGMELEEFLEKFALGVDEGYIFVEGDAMPGFVETAEWARDRGHTNHVVTYRKAGMRDARNTEEWLYRVGFPFDSLTFSKDKTIVKNDIFIEDNADNFHALKRDGVEAYLINRPWNDHVQTSHRVRDFEDFKVKIVEWEHRHGHF